jgi:excisionase family DNA binding protein
MTLVTADEAAKALGVSRTLVYRLVNANAVPYCALGLGTKRKTVIRFDLDELSAWARERREAAAKPAAVAVVAADKSKGGDKRNANRRHTK